MTTTGYSLIELARAKVNLTLRVRGRRADGFHELDSVVAFANVGDELTWHAAAAPSVHVTGRFGAVITGENLVARALALVVRTAPWLRTGAITITKHLPVAAGLGGGSADAAAALRLIQRANPTATLDWYALAAQLGSDVPVCLANSPCRMSGRGDVLTALLPPVTPLDVVLINPCVAVPADKTRQVFQRLAAPAVRPFTIAAPGEWMSIAIDGCNDLQAPAIALMPAITAVLSAARADRRTLAARVSGAGPTCFAVTASAETAECLAVDLAARQPTWWVCATQLG